jgi:hypothetical protein
MRYNIMVNPTGKEGAFRGANWVEESNSLFIKVPEFLISLGVLIYLYSSMTKAAEVLTTQRNESWKNPHWSKYIAAATIT